MPAIQLPHNWTPRPYQQNLWDYLVGGGKRAVPIWHRRSGKDAVCLQFMALAATQRVGTYWYMGPTLKQARMAFWDARDPYTHQRRIYDAFIGPYNPSKNQFGLIENSNENEMSLELLGGSMVHFVGSDNYETLIGSPPVGLVFSEFSRADPQSWNMLRPILAENNGWAIFPTTPNGTNHAHALYREAAANPKSFAELLPVSKTGVYGEETLAEELSGFISQNGEDVGKALYDQEYNVSFAAGAIGAYFAREMEQADQEGRITNIPYDPRVPVFTSWDLGYSDSTAIWLIQLVGKEVRCIDYIENSNVGLDWYVKELQKRSYVWGQHIFPHDTTVHELGSGRSRVETLRSLGINPRIIPLQSIPDGINALRTLIPSIWFDPKCKRGIEALRQYKRTWDEKRKVFSDRPYHDWTSHPVDSLRYFALSNVRNVKKREIKYSNTGIV